MNYFKDEKGLINAYDKEDNKMFSAKPENIAFEKHYYKIDDETNEADPELIENLFSRIETYGGSAIKKILSKDSLNDKEKSNLFTFIACMFIRGPNYRSNVDGVFEEFVKQKSKYLASNKSYFNKNVDQILKKKFLGEAVPSEQIRQYILNGEYSININPMVSIYSGLKSILVFGDILFHMNWNFCMATEEWRFLTCDNPVFVFDPTYDPKGMTGVGFMNKNVEITFPISKDLCAVGGWNLITDYIYVQAKNQMIKNINRRTISSAHRFVYSSSRNEKLLKAVSKYKGSEPRMVVR